MKVAEYVLIQDFTYDCGSQDSRTLLAGTFVKPIDPRYIPKHVLEDQRWKYFNKERDTFVYMHYGIVVVPKKIVREI